MDADYGKSGGESREGGIILAVTVLLLSLAAHVGLMATVSDRSFMPPPVQVKSDRKWTRELPPMQMRRLAEDPLAHEMNVEARPVAAPVEEKTERRVDRLNESVAREAVPELPSVTPDAPADASVAEPAKVDAAEWVPRQEIVAIDTPVVPDDAAALPRLVIPKVERVASAPDVAPAFDLIGEPGGAGGGLGSSDVPPTAPVAEKTASSFAPVAALPPAAAPISSVGGGLDQPSLSSAAETFGGGATEDKARHESQAENKTAVEPPPPSPPAASKVDEKVVAEEKKAVRELRDDVTKPGTPFEKNVDASLAQWIDPARPDMKYFRVRLASREVDPLPVISKDIVFLVDASGSIANDRLKSCRKAINEALRTLNSGDRFNVVAFRDKFEYCFTDTAWKAVTRESLDRAESWLAKQTSHGQTDVFRTLRGVLAMPRDPARPVVALVITDGDATSGLTRSAEIISRFSDLNGGLVSVYMYGVKPNANAYLMDMLTRGNRGDWARHESKFRWNAAAGIPQLARKFARPVLADMSVIFSASSNAEAYPRLVTNLCEGEPMEIFGVCPAKQRDLVFSVRGLNGADVYESLFRLDFATAEKADGSLRGEWAKRRLYEMVAAYAARPEKKLLDDMHSFARSHGIQVPYEKEMKK